MNAAVKMVVHNLVQGAPEWHQHRFGCWNASDAAAMLGLDPHRSRTELLDELVRGFSPEVSSFQQKVFDGGHRREGFARPLGEQVIGEDLYPLVGSRAWPGLSKPLGASLDGLTMARTYAWEHKQLNEELRAALPYKDLADIAQNDASKLPKRFRVQMEQQCMVTGCEGVLFSTSDCDEAGNVTDSRHCWYAPDPALRAEIIAGWKQLEADLATHVPKAPAAVVVAAPVKGLPAVAVQVAGEIAIRHNFDAFEIAVRDFIEHRLIREPKTDQDFADLDQQIKAMKGAEAALESAEQNWIAQIEAVGSAKRTKDMLAKLVRDNRLMAEKLLASEKERRRGEIVAAAVKAFEDHVAGLNARLGKPYMPPIPTDFGGCIKGLKSLASMEDKVATELARAKIAANEAADKIDVNLKTLREKAADYRFLFNDAASLVLKAPDDCLAVITSRIAEHKAEQDRRAAELAERERARIRAEEAARLGREQQARAAEERRQREEQARRDLQAKEAATRSAPEERMLPPCAGVSPVAAFDPTDHQDATVDNVHPLPTRSPAAPTTQPTLRLGQINERIAPLSIDAAGLAALGFPHSATDKAAKLYHEHQFHGICAAIAQHAVAAANRQRQAA